MGDLCSAHNDMVDRFTDHDDELQLIQIKLRNVPETVQQSDLVQYLMSLMCTLVPELTDLEIDRAHRFPKPPHVPASTPRDVLARIHFFTTKERVMFATKRTARMPDSFSTVAFYADLSKATMENCRQLVSITKALQNHKIQCKWSFPTKLLITRQNKIHTVRASTS